MLTGRSERPKPKREIDPEATSIEMDRETHRARISRADAVIREGMAQADSVFRRPYGGHKPPSH